MSSKLFRENKIIRFRNRFFFHFHQNEINGRSLLSPIISGLISDMPGLNLKPV